jgi:hypothetical protein
MQGLDVGGRYPRETLGMRMITQRSQVQVLSPLRVKVQVRGPFALRIAEASGVRDRMVTANAATGCGWMWVVLPVRAWILAGNTR